jgi:hypothetical protein
VGILTGTESTYPTTENGQRRPVWLGWLRWGGGAAAVGVVLMLCYLRVAGTTPVLSDGAGNALQAWDMLHGDLLLHGWWVTDVSFWTTELPEYMLVEAAVGLRPEVVHICAALTYTLLVLFAAWVARGRARGADGIVRAVIAAGIMLAPEPGAATWVVLTDPDHIGTGVPLLLLLLVLDRGRARWWAPVAAFVLLTWSSVADPIVLVAGTVPLAGVCAVRGCAVLVRGRGGFRAALRSVWYEAAMACAAVLSVGGKHLVNHAIVALGGYRTSPAPLKLVPLAQVKSNLPYAVRGVLAIFGADPWDASGPRGQHGLLTTFTIVHFVGFGLVVAAVVLALWQLLRTLFRPAPLAAALSSTPGGGVRPEGQNRDGAGDLVADVLAVAVVINVAAFPVAFRLHNVYTAHELGPVLALGAALAGRMLGGPLVRAWRERRRIVRLAVVPVLAATLACYGAMLAYDAIVPGQTPPANAALAVWLTDHGLHSGLSGYWEASVVTLETDKAITMGSVALGRDRRLAPWRWEMDMRIFDPADHQANFVVLADDGLSRAEVLRTFGKPARVYQVQGDTVMVWHKNLLTDLSPAVN